MKITTLIENTQDENKLLKFEHGLSMYIETDDCKVLFDTGKSGDFIDNAEKLNIDLKNIDVLVLSHAHYDHCGGVRRLLDAFNITPKIIVGEHFFEKAERYHCTDGIFILEPSLGTGDKYIGIDFDESYLQSRNIPIEYVHDNVLKLSNNIFIFGNFNKYYDFEILNSSLKLKVDDKYEVDTFDDEISIGIKTKNGIVALVGCSHPGFLNILKSMQEITNEKILGIIGGTHLVDADSDRIAKTIKCINNYNPKLFGLSHCTGEDAVRALSKNCKNVFINKTGTILNLE